MKKFLLCWGLVCTNLYTDPAQNQFKLGIENSAALQPLVARHWRIGLVTNSAGRSQLGIPTLHLLKNYGFRVAALCIPEHGLQGKITAGASVKDGAYQDVPVISLYQNNGPRSLLAENIATIDAFFVDLQDAGMRHYTYISTLYHVLQTAAAHNKEVVVLDRPNPLGHVMEGPLVEPEFISFIAIAPIPVRHGMTMGELARYFNAHCLPQPVRLTVVPMEHYNRTQGLMRLHAPLSPNLASKQSVHGYSFLGLLSEIGPFDVGVGTKYAFRCLTLPEATFTISEKKWIALSLQLEQLTIGSTSHRYYHPQKKQWYRGLLLHIRDINQVPALRTLMMVVNFFKKENVLLTFRSFDKAAGTTALREHIEGRMPKIQFAQKVHANIQSFLQQAQHVLLYRPFPAVMSM